MGVAYSDFSKYSNIRKSLDKNQPELCIKDPVGMKVNDVINMSIVNQARFVDSNTRYHYLNEIWCLNQIKNFSDESHIIREIYNMDTDTFGNLAFISLNGPTADVRKTYRRVLEIAILCMQSRLHYERKFKRLEEQQLQYSINI